MMTMIAQIIAFTKRAPSTLEGDAGSSSLGSKGATDNDSARTDSLQYEQREQERWDVRGRATTPARLQ
jgi:hypothetical protein